MTKNKHVAILIAFGPEIRAFIHSGMVKNLARRWRVTLFTAVPESEAFTDLENISVLPLPDAYENKYLQRIRYWAIQAHQAWLNTQGRKRWRHYIPQNTPKKRGPIKQHVLKLMQMQMVSNLFLRFERLFARLFGTHPKWKVLIINNDIDCIIVASFGNSRILPALQTASNLGRHSVVIMNSWKDVYTHPYMSIIPSRIAVWSEKIADDLSLANPHLPTGNLAVYPSLHLESFLTPDAIMSRERFYAAIGLDPQHDYICYTAASPKAVKNEEVIVEFILHAIEAGRLANNLKLILRLNPMEDGSRFAHLAAQYPGLIIQTPQWEWDEKRDWCCALSQDVDCWTATVFYSRLNISIPSTVTLEFLAFSRPVINICFDPIEGISSKESIIRFWNADFYAEIKEHHLVQPAFDFEQLISQAQQILEQPTSYKSQTLPSPATNSPVQKTYEILEEILER